MTSLQLTFRQFETGNAAGPPFESSGWLEGHAYMREDA